MELTFLVWHVTGLIFVALGWGLGMLRFAKQFIRSCLTRDHGNSFSTKAPFKWFRRYPVRTCSWGGVSLNSAHSDPVASENE
ncbi:hypothetical protein SAICODRAFT_186096 [Saitoella complicata NRRL Y-17804]|uniref:uncharacterized protein n=1 Tax=Saitoella complicata (strain BCRC 22490 / CBS 7301 / JCM 7358 / NBRC 10748 / NRRL Y-17804) TaxID=698492 RepID=UPI000867FD4D|nr:uncharacterized protein SAICODRAFT_186096 [Saitoella complicata NRRL Y-17804]ODQ55494.1 hypothetical protein SAICODRAFT_186096 [Saitoella complicata NRRL Y-17804]